MKWSSTILGLVGSFIAGRITGGWSVGTSFDLPTFWTNPKKETMPPNPWKYFTDEEVAGLKDNLPALLDMARGISGVPFVLTSTTRTCAANQAALGAEHSTHILGLAVDIGLGHLAEGGERDAARFAILNGLIKAGFTRLGLYSDHIHCDIGKDPDYVQSVSWFSPNA